MMKTRNLISMITATLLLALGILLVACGPEQPSPNNSTDSNNTSNNQPRATPLPVGPTPTIPALDSDVGAITGRITTEMNISPNMRIYLANYYQHENEGWGFYMLEPNIAISAPVNSEGYFQALNVPPGDYVVVVGELAEESVPIQEDANNPKVFSVVEGQVVDIGEQMVDLAGPPALSPVDVGTTGSDGYPAPAGDSYP